MRVRGGATTASWLVRYVSPTTKQRRTKGVGAYPTVSLREARARAAEVRRVVTSGVDPLGAPAASTTGDESAGPVTFAKAAGKVIEAKREAWRNAKHQAQWRNTLATYCAPIASKPVGEVTRADVVQ